MAMWVGREEEIPAYRLAHNQEATPATLGLFQACEAGDAAKVAEFLKQSGRANYFDDIKGCLLYTSPSPRDKRQSRMPSSA